MSPDEEQLLRIARGCRDYGGGYRSNAKDFEIYQHGIETVIHALERAVAKRDDSQVKALERIGKNEE